MDWWGLFVESSSATFLSSSGISTRESRTLASGRADKVGLLRQAAPHFFQSSALRNPEVRMDWQGLFVESSSATFLSNSNWNNHSGIQNFSLGRTDEVGLTNQAEPHFFQPSPDLCQPMLRFWGIFKWILLLPGWHGAIHFTSVYNSHRIEK